MIKVFTTNKDGKIELTKKELKSLLDEAYYEGVLSNCGVYTYSSPSFINGTSTINADYIKNGTIESNIHMEA